MSLFVPRVFKNITGERIKTSMEGFGLGEVERVDLVSKEGYNAAYIHFKIWNNTSFVAQFQQRAADPEQKCTLEYDSPWYWIVLENTSAKRVGSERNKEVVNLRDSFVPIAPGLSEEDMDMDNKEMIADIIWELQVMQGEINELRECCEQSGYNIPEREYNGCDEQVEEDKTALDEIKQQMESMQEEIRDLRFALCVTDAVTGNTFLRSSLNEEYEDYTDYGIYHKPNNGGITRDVADCMKTDLYPSEVSNDISLEFWDEWEPIEVPSEDVPGMCNQMYKSKISGEISDLCDLLERGLEQSRNKDQSRNKVQYHESMVSLDEMHRNYIDASRYECY